MPKIPVVVAVEKENKYSVSVLLGYLLKRLREERLDDRFRFILTNWANVSEVLSSLNRPHVLAASLLTTQVPSLYSRVQSVLELSRRLGGISVAGGPHATGDPYGTILSLGFDIAFIGEAEESFAEFTIRLAQGGDPLSVSGVTAISEDGIKISYSNKPRVQNLDLVPPFCSELGLFNPIEIMRGCPHACRYCQVSYLFGTSPRFRSAENVVSFAKELLNRGIRDIRFVSPSGFEYMCSKNLNLGALSNLLEALDREVRSLGGRVYLGTFPSEVRPEHVTEETLRTIKAYVDNKRLNIGAQTGSERLLKLLHRGHSADDVLNAVVVASRHGFGVDVDYIFGLPWEDSQDLESTMRQIEKVIQLGGRIHCHAFIPLPGTPLSFASPRAIPEFVKSRLVKMMGKGKVWGQWLRQEGLAREIVLLRESNVIVISHQRANRIVAEKSGLIKRRFDTFHNNLHKIICS
ncbi:MAG: TIGR04013 family B12-binding domain/radical SAM domain-containing protein [Sulfolobales archaeon]